jgi:hypothetical protein
VLLKRQCPRRGLTMAEPKKCAHAICSCICSDGKKYCSQMCEDSKKMTTLKCDCKHPGCTGH